MAEIVDDDEDDEPSRPTLPPPGPRPRSRELPTKGRPAQPAASSETAEISLADLAGLDADPIPARKPASRPASSSASLKAPSNPALAGTRPAAMPIAAFTEDDDEEVFGAEGPARRGGPDLPMKTWIAAGVMVGLAIAIVGFGASMVVSMSRTEPEPEPIAGPPNVEPESPVNAPITTYVPTRGTRPVGPTPKASVDLKSKVATPAQPEAPAVVAKPRPEEIYDKAWETKLGPPPSGRPAPPPGRSTFVVRRLAQGADETPSFAAALGRGNDLVEIADVGPFFEDDYQIAGKSRLIRAREGLRPMIKIEGTTNPIIKAQAAKFVLGGTKVDHLVFEGIDFAVDVRDLPVHQTTLFLCQGVDLTLRNCSLTILNANDPARTNPFSVFRLEEGPRPNRIVLDRTMVRGSIRTLVEVASAQADVEFDRSLILGDAGPLLVAGPGEKSARSFYFRRSLLVTRGPVLELAGKGGATLVRALGSTFARVEGTAGAGLGLFATRAAFAGEPPSVLDWAGEANHFVGWPAWLASMGDGSARVARLDGVKSAWPGSDGSSRESPSAWPAHVRPDAAIPLDFAHLEPGLVPTLAMAAVPHPRLRELTLDSLARLVTPELSATLVTPYVAPLAAAPLPGRPIPPAAAAPKPTAPTPNATGPRLKNQIKAGGPGMPGAGPAVPGPLNLTFNLNESPWMGDLGLYLAEKLVRGTPWASITVRGSGVYPMTPIRLPDGISISILGDQTLGIAAAMPTFVPKPGSTGRSMIELRGGDLAIANLGFSTEGAQRPEHWISVEDGILGIRHCRFRDSGPAPAPTAVPSTSGALIAFVARGTAPIPPRAGPLVKETNRPTARLQHTALWTTGPALGAEVGRGSVALDDCLVISGGPAFTLLPADVDRDRFEADLVLDRCTVAVDRTSVLLGPLSGEPKGPSRPWLVSTRRSAFPRTQPVGGAGALFQTDPDALARGSLFWQSSFDVYDVYHFLAPTGPAPANQPATDIKKQWLDLWGEAHTKGDQGPTARRSETSLRYKERDRPKPGKVVPTALELDKAIHPDLGADFNNLPTFVAGRTPTDPATRPGPGARFDRP
jgi:serine/threonine-protein kinase